MRVSAPLFWLFAFGLLLVGCGARYDANATWEAEINGVCEACPAIRMDTLVRKLEGVVQLQFDSSRKVLRVHYDSGAVKVSQLVATLNDAGYDVGDEASFFPTLVDACCIRSPQDLAALLNPKDTIGLDPIAKQALLDSLRQLMVDDAESLDELMDDMLGDAPDYDEVLRNDLLGPGQSVDVGSEDDILPDVPPDMSPRDIEEDDADISRSLDENSTEAARPRQQPAKPKSKPKSQPARTGRNR